MAVGMSVSVAAREVVAVPRMAMARLHLQDPYESNGVAGRPGETAEDRSAGGLLVDGEGLGIEAGGKVDDFLP